jgi:hypothetical protein
MGRRYTANRLPRAGAEGNRRHGPCLDETARAGQGRPAGLHAAKPIPGHGPARRHPVNWSRWATRRRATYAPAGAFFDDKRQSGFTHGIEFGTAKGTGNLQRDTESLLQGFAKSNPQLRRRGQRVRDTVDGRRRADAR